MLSIKLQHHPLCKLQDREEGLLGVCDFFTSSKYDLPLRQMTWLRRFFW